MTLGGNANAREALGENVLNAKDLATKYTSRSSLIYKEKLQKKAKESEQKNDRLEATPDTNLIHFDPPPQQQQQLSLLDLDDYHPVNTPFDTTTDDDAFDIFKPVSSTIKSPPSQSIFDDLASPKQTTKKSVFDELASNTNDLHLQPAKNAAVDDFFDQFEKTPAAAPPKRAFKPKATQRHTKLGARKVQNNVFQQQNELALQEEKMRQEGIDEESIGRHSRNHVLANTATEDIPKLAPPSSTRLNYQYEPTKEESLKSKESVALDKERLGMMSLSNQNTKKAHPLPETTIDEDTFARVKFGNAKAISSDQFFGRNDYNPERSAANASRLAQFGGSQSISSDQFFGRKPNTGSTPMSKKILRVASKGATKLQQMMADLEVHLLFVFMYNFMLMSRFLK